jgi:hypothetical protein
MAKGWTCGRCAAQNDEAAVSCRACGFIRGGVIPAPNPLVAPQPAAAPPASPGAPASPDPAAPAAAGWSSAPASSATAGWPPRPSGVGAEGLSAAGAGQTVDAAAFPGWTGAPAGAAISAPRRRVRFPIGWILLLVLIAGGAAVSWFTDAGRNSSGEIDKAGAMSVSDLRVGDCYDLPGDAASFDENATVDTTTAMPCTDAHHYEVFYTGTMAGGGSYPTNAEFGAWTKQYCVPAFADYVGAAYAESALDVYTFTPTAAGWARGDRGMQCSLADQGLQPLTGSLKGSQR